MTTPRLNIHALLPRSRANGPGWRSVIWFQGCTLNCPGCFNPDTHATAPRQLFSPRQLVDWCVSVADVEGVTISGGEPLQQAGQLCPFLRLLRAETMLSVVLFSGYTRVEIEAHEAGPSILARVDVLVAGRYDHARKCSEGLRSSLNQEVHFLSGRYGPADLSGMLVEAVISPAGQVQLTGFPQ